MLRYYCIALQQHALQQHALQKGIGAAWLGPGGLKLERRVGSGVHAGVPMVGSTAQQLRLRDTMLADLRSQNKALAGAAKTPPLTPNLTCNDPVIVPCAVCCQLTKALRLAFKG